MGAPVAPDNLIHISAGLHPPRGKRSVARPAGALWGQAVALGAPGTAGLGPVPTLLLSWPSLLSRSFRAMVGIEGLLLKVQGEVPQRGAPTSGSCLW